jgi:urease accessory protein
MSLATLLLLADGRFPSGGHAHSGGVEAACATGGIVDVPTLATFVRGRLHTAGLVDASFAAAAASGVHAWPDLDRAVDARIVSPRLRLASRALGRQALRAGERVWPHPSLLALRDASPSEGAHQCIVLGAVAAAAELASHDAALCVLHNLASSSATAAVRLLGLDPYEVHAMLASFTDVIGELADAADARCRGPLPALPATSSPLVDILAEDHATWEVRLFAS